MAEYLIQDSTLTDIADAIREQYGLSSLTMTPPEMAKYIRSMCGKHTNMVPKAISNSSGTIYNSVGYRNGVYLSSGTVNAYSTDSACVSTGSILLPSGVNSIYVKGATWNTSNSHVRLFAGAEVGGLGYLIYANGSGTSPAGAADFFTIETLGTNYYRFTLTSSGKTYLYGKYYRFSLVGTGENLIITHDEPIHIV